MTDFAKIALLDAFLATVILSSLHHAVTATVGTPAVLSSHLCTLFGIYIRIYRVYTIVKSFGDVFSRQITECDKAEIRVYRKARHGVIYCLSSFHVNRRGIVKV